MGRCDERHRRRIIFKTMFFDVINSGSKGNATLVFTHEATFLIDVGTTLKVIEEELSKYNKTINDIDAVFVTHNHIDHIRSLKSFSPKKIYALEKTVPGSLSNVIKINEPFKIKDAVITAFPTSHDAINPCGYMIESDNEKLVYMTDTGTYLSSNTPIIKNPDYLIIESNHDIRMQLLTNRPMELIQRIFSDYGHLCNEDSAFATLEIIGENTKEIILAHLSEEANSPEAALAAYKKIFEYAQVDINKYHVRCAHQRIPTIGGNYDR